MATVTLHQKRTNEPDGTFKVVSTIQESNGIQKEMFVKEKETGAFSHVANVFELALPKTDGPTPEMYVEDICEKSFTEVATAIAFVEELKRRVTLLCDEYTEEADSFVGEDETALPVL